MRPPVAMMDDTRTVPDDRRGRPRGREWGLASAFALLALTLLLPWPRPAVSLRGACDLADAGPFAVECDLVAAAERSGRPWLRRDIRVYEDGVRLRYAERAGDVRREHPGSYLTTGLRLTFSAFDRSDPRTNGREYVARPAEFDPLGLARGPRRALAATCVAVAFVLAGAAAGTRRNALAWATAIAVAAACVLVQAVAVLRAAPVHVDAGYALSSAEAVAAGAVPYRTLLFNYTPLGVYQFALVSRLWRGGGPAPYWFYLAFVGLNEVACSAFVFLILRRAAVGRWLAALSAACYLSMTLWFDGARVLFEPLYLWPILAAAWLALRGDRAAWAAAGALAAVALMTKQYGGYGLVGLLLFALADGRAGLRRAWLPLAGFALALAVLLLLGLAIGLDVRGLAAQALGLSYPRRYETTWLRLFLRQCPIALFALAAPLLPGAWSRPAVRLATCFGLASCLPFYFRQHQYYFLNVCPWLFILFALGVAQVAETRPPVRAALSGLAAALLLTIPIRAAAAQAPLLEAEIRSDQLRRGRLMNDAWPAGRPTLLFAYPGLYHVAHYRSADEAGLGYRFPNECTAEQLRRGFRSASGAWVDPRGMYARGADRVLREAGTSLEQELVAHGFQKRLVVEDRFELWTKESLREGAVPR